MLHASGRRDHDELAARLDELGSPPHYHLHAYIDPFADALAAADLVVARSGGSVLEVAAAGLPSVLVPYPHATADHQTLNARHMERAGAAVVVPDDELDGPRLAHEVAALLGSPTGWRPWAAQPRRWRARTRRASWPTSCWQPGRGLGRRSAPAGARRQAAVQPRRRAARPDPQAGELAHLGAAGHADLDDRPGAVEQLAPAQADRRPAADAPGEGLGPARRRGS